MRKLPQNISLLAVSILTVGFVSAAPVYAREATSGSSDSTESSNAVTADDTTATGGDASHTSGSADSSTNVKHSDSTETEDPSTTSVKELHSRAEQLLTTERQTNKGKSLEERQKACQVHKDEIVKRQQDYARNAKKNLDTFNSVYDKVLAFQADKKLTATNFDQLKAAADAKKAVATTAVADLSDASMNVDCSSSDPAAAVATLKTAVVNARTALQDYRVAIKNVIVALQSANSAANTNTSKSGGTN